MTSEDTPQQKGVLDIARKGGVLAHACEELARLHDDASDEVLDAVWHRDVQKAFNQLTLAVMNYSIQFMPNTLEATYQKMKERHDGDDSDPNEE